jgi:NADPH-dependent 2,4-dienoyl-CoA reductase/sulfur reductase-like enzyme
MRGHSVKIYEKTSRIGGALLAGSYPPFKGEMTCLFTWERHELEKLGVTIQTETELTPEMVKKEDPDALIVAIGGKPTIPPVPGVDKPHVVIAQDILFGKVIPGERCLVAGGGDIGFETAAFLAATLWRDVTIVEMLPKLAEEHDPSSRDYFLSLYDKWHVKQLVNTKLIEIGEKTVVLEGKNGPYVYETDTVVLALGTKSDPDMAEALKAAARKTIVIGDAAKAREAVDATREGFKAGLEV